MKTEIGQDGRLTDGQAKSILVSTWAERTKLWLASKHEGYWIRARPSLKNTPPSPYLMTPGVNRFSNQPDGLWLYFANYEWVDAVCVEHCGSIQNLNDKRSRYMPTLGSMVVRVKPSWLNQEISVENGGSRPRWERCKSIEKAPSDSGEYFIPVRQYRVLYALKKEDYEKWIPEHVPMGHEYFCTHAALSQYNTPKMQSFLKSMNYERHFLMLP